nr:hypothetical protein [uncultured Methylotenera sp.]
MSNPKFEIINSKEIRIGERVLSYHQHTPPLNDNTIYSIDASANSSDTHTQKLYPYDFNGIKPTDFPNGLSISLTISQSEFSNVCFFLVSKMNDQAEISIIVDLLFKEWHLPISLSHFTEIYKSALFEVVTNISDVEIELTDVGYFVIAKTKVLTNSTIGSAYIKLSKEVLFAYRKSLASLTNIDKPYKNLSSTPTDNIGLRWWIRYVVVPIIGSGTFVAAIIWLSNVF